MDVTATHLAVGIAALGVMVAVATWIGKVWGSAKSAGALESSVRALMQWKHEHMEMTERKVAELEQVRITVSENAVQMRYLIEQVNRLVTLQDETNRTILRVAAKINGGAEV